MSLERHLSFSVLQLGQLQGMTLRPGLGYRAEEALSLGVRVIIMG